MTFQPLFQHITLICFSLFGLIAHFSSFAQEPTQEMIPVETLDWTTLPGKDYGKLRWYEIIHQPEVTYEDVRKAFYKEWYMRPYEKGKMYKQYKRYETMTYGMIEGQEKALPIYQQVQAKTKMISPAQPKSLTASWVTRGPNGPLNPSTWNNQGIGRIDEVAFDPTNENIMFAGSPSGGLWKSTDGGASWTVIGSDWSNLGISGIEIYPPAPSTIYVSTGDRDSGSTKFYGIQKSTNGGTSWTLINGPASANTYGVNKFLVDPTNDNNLFLATKYDGVWYSTNNGTTWTKSTGINQRVVDLEFHPNNPNILYAARYGEWYKSTDGGVSFTQQTTGVLFNTSNSQNINIGVTANNDDLVFFYVWDTGISSFKIYKYATATATYTQVADPTAPAIHPNGTPTDMSNYYWGQQTYDWAFAVNPNDENDMIIGDISMFRSTDGGANWMVMSSSSNNGGSVHVDMHTLEYSPISFTPFVGCDGGLYKFNGIGNQWTRLNDMGISQTYRLGVHPLNDDKIVCGNQDNGCFYNDGTQWNYEVIGDGGDAFFDPINVDTFYMSIGPNGSIRKTQDSGGTFTTIFSESLSGETASWQFPFQAHPYLRHVLYAGHQNLWKSLDGGNSWNKISNNELSSNVMRHLQVAPSNPDYIYMAGLSSSAGIHYSTDGGQTWNTATWPFPSSYLGVLKVSPSDEMTLYAASSSTISAVKKSTNGGMTWTDLSSGLAAGLGFRTLDVVEGLTDELYIGDNVGVYHKSNGNNWQVFDTGLPNVIVNELEVNEFDGTITAATYGRGIWESPLENTTSVCYETRIPSLDLAGIVNSCASSETITIINAVPAGYTIEWYKDDVVISGATGTTLNVTEGGAYSARFIGACKTFSSEAAHLFLGQVANVDGYSESFETSITYANLPSDNIDWTRLSGSTLSSGTGPTAAFDGSYYLYVEASDPNYPNKVAILETGCFDLSGYNAPLLNFACHLYGANMGSLEVQISTNDGSTWNSIFMLSGDQGDQWLSQSVDLAAYANTEAKFRFIGTTGDFWRSDIAIDYIHFEEGSSCPPDLEVTANPIPDGTYKAINLLQSSGSVPATGNVIFQSQNEILLEEGFEVILGAAFEAFIDVCN